METTIKRIAPYRDNGAAYEHMISRSALVDGKRLKFSELVKVSISTSLGYPCDLSIYRMPNMAVHYVMQYLRKRGLTVEPINNYNFGKERLKYLLEECSPNCIGISSSCHVEAAPIREIVDYIRSINKNVLIIVGGPFINSINYEYVNLQQDYLLQRMGADVYVHERQGQDTVYKICMELRKEKPDFSAIPNIIYRQNGKCERTEKIPENICLDDDPIKDFTFYKDHVLPPVYVQTALSCSLKCAFCRYPILSGEPMYMDLSSVERNMSYIHSLGVKWIIFIDDSLNIPLDRFKDLLRMMIKNKYGFQWFSFFRISHSDEETYELMAKSGCKGVILGIESGNNTILKNMDKQVTVEKLFWGIQQLSAHDILSYASCMIGFPGETIETAKDTIDFIETAKPSFYDLQCWFYENAVPIAKENKYYNLQGYGYSWSHKDMDSQTAGKIVTEAIRSIQKSYFLPSLSFNLWSLGYFLSQGATVDEFKNMCIYFKKLLAVEPENIDTKYNEELNSLMHVFEGNMVLEENLKLRHNKL